MTLLHNQDEEEPVPLDDCDVPRPDSPAYTFQWHEEGAWRWGAFL